MSNGRVVGIQSYNTNNLFVPASLTTVLISDKNPSRVQTSVLNDTATGILTVIFAGGKTLAQADALLTAGRKTAKIAAGGYFEIPANYVGEVYGKWSVADGNAELTEYV